MWVHEADRILCIWGDDVLGDVSERLREDPSILTDDGVNRIRAHIQQIHPEFDRKKSADILADAIHKSLDRYLPGFVESVRQQLRVCILTDAINRGSFYIDLEHVYSASLETTREEASFFSCLAAWLSKHLDEDISESRFREHIAQLDVTATGQADIEVNAEETTSTVQIEEPPHLLTTAFQKVLQVVSSFVVVLALVSTSIKQQLITLFSDVIVFLNRFWTYLLLWKASIWCAWTRLELATKIQQATLHITRSSTMIGGSLRQSIQVIFSSKSKLLFIPYNSTEEQQPLPITSPLEKRHWLSIFFQKILQAVCSIGIAVAIESAGIKQHLHTFFTATTLLFTRFWTRLLHLKVNIWIFWITLDITYHIQQLVSNVIHSSRVINQNSSQRIFALLNSKISLDFIQDYIHTARTLVSNVYEGMRKCKATIVSAEKKQLLHAATMVLLLLTILPSYNLWTEVSSLASSGHGFTTWPELEVHKPDTLDTPDGIPIMASPNNMKVASPTQIKEERQMVPAVQLNRLNKPTVMPSRTRNAMTMIATAYDLSVESCGKTRDHPAYGITFTGTRATYGRTIAVDPKVIPLGSTVYIHFPEEYAHMNGIYIAEDTGRLIKGNKIDIFFGEDKPGERVVYQQALRFGVRRVEVTVLSR